MATSLKFVTVLICFSLYLAGVHAINNTNSTGTNDVSAVILDNESAFAVCVYPTSGTYSFLNRLLYYCTLIFSLFSRAHLWLVAGALVAALFYSGAAAVHACLLVWRGPNPYIENDSWALYAILNAACLMTVPLLNWSGTLRRLGAKAADMKDRKRLETNSDVGTRTIVIYWAFLVLIGFICIWEQAQYGESDLDTEYPDMGKVMCNPGTNASLLLSPNGTFHRRAIDGNFIQDNGCSDPCNLINIPSVFRNQNELVLLSHSEALLWNYTLPGAKYQKAERLLNDENKVSTLDWWSLPFIVVQGFITAFFGRRDPREIRDLIYITLFMEHPLSKRRFLVCMQEGIVRVFAALNYLIAIAVVIFCPVLFIVSLVSQEFQLWTHFPDSEKPFQVGQWTPWVYTALVILAALIARYHDRVIELICDSGRSIAHAISGHQKSYKYKEPEHGRVSVSEDRKMHLEGDIKAEPPKTSTEELPSRKSSFVPLSISKTSLKALIIKLTPQIYKTCCRPLNQNDHGLRNEIINFSHWLRDPQAVSRRVIRHPIRPHDAENARLSAEATEMANHKAHRGDDSGGFFRGASMERHRGHP